MIPCPKCHETNWMQYCLTSTYYPIAQTERGNWTFGDPEIVDDIETERYSCGSCGYDASDNEQASIEEAVTG